MNRRIRISSCILVSVLALAACARNGNGSSGQDSAGIAGLGSSPSAGDRYASPAGDNTGTGSGNGSGSGSGGHSTPSPSTNPTGPRIVSFTASGAVCPVTGTPYADRPGQVTISWKIANADTVDLYMDGGLWHNGYPGTQSSDTLPFQCPDTSPSQKTTHNFTLVIKNTSIKKTVSATAPSNPRGMG